jgi:hypothetical protein
MPLVQKGRYAASSHHQADPMGDHALVWVHPDEEVVAGLRRRTLRWRTFSSPDLSSWLMVERLGLAVLR